MVTIDLSPRLSVDASLQGSDNHPNLRRNEPEALRLSFLNGLAIVLGIQIGSGIFSAPSQVSLHVFSPGEAVLVWLFAGLLAWTGAASFIELGMAIPRNGGMQEYLQFCYGDFAGFLFTWIWVVIVKPSGNAVIATVLADYLSFILFPLEATPLLLSKLIGVLAVITIALVNCSGAKAGPNVANGFLFLKLLLVISIIALGILLCSRTGNGVPSTGLGWFKGGDDEKQLGIWTRFGNLVTALLGALFCYGGWESIGFVVGEMVNSDRNLPRVLNCAMIITSSSFVLVVVAFYLCLPMDDIRAKTTLAVEFGQQILGLLGARIYAIAISISALGAINANIFASAKLCVAASQRGYFPAILANLHFDSGEDEMRYYRDVLKRYPSWVHSSISAFAQITADLRLNKSIPIYAILLNTSLTMFYVIVGTFNGLLIFVGLSEYLIFFFCVLGIFIIRARGERGSELQTYRTWTLNPVIFISVSFLLVLRGVIANALQGVAILVVVIMGWILFTLRFPKSSRYSSIAVL